MDGECGHARKLMEFFTLAQDDAGRFGARAQGPGPTLRMAIIVWASRTFMALDHGLILAKAALAESLSH